MDLSGRERDKLFMSQAGKGLVDRSYLSGADSLEDARAVALVDLDHDGHEDLVVVNRNAPLLRVYLNRVGAASKHHFVGVHLEGARQVEAIGARATVRACGQTQLREVSMGTGFSTANSLTNLFGLGTCAVIDELRVHFPAGEERAWTHLAVDQLYRVVEGKGLKQTAYSAAPTTAAAPVVTQSLLRTLPKRVLGGRPLVLVDLYASWCEACKRQDPLVDDLALELAADLDVVALSVEPTDDEVAIARLPPSRHVRLPWDMQRAAALRAIVGEAPPLPSSLLLDAKTGAVLWRSAGLPTRSDFARVAFDRERKLR